MNRLFATLAAASTVIGTAAFAQTVATQLVGNGLTRPVFVTAPAGDTGRLFVAESRYRASSGDPWSGRIRIINLATNTTVATPFLTLTPPGGVASTVTNVYIAEQGLLGLAFHPDYAQNGYFYVHHTRGSDAAVIIARLRANAPYATSGTADPASYTPIMTIPHPQTNHNGGWIAFGPDGNFYIALGDGGNGNDTGTGHSSIGNGQDLSTVLGKILRIDVDGPDGIPGNADDADPVTGAAYRIPATNPFTGASQRKEIWAYGLRNPWRNSFDRATGDLWIADVGQDLREEINVAIANPAGRNYGWKCQEGLRCTALPNCPTCPSLPSGTTPPIADYDHVNNIAPFNFTGCAITGGYVYRGCAMPWLRGSYFFTDNCNPRIFTLRSNGGAPTDVTDRSVELNPPGSANFVAISSFGEDASGELYIVDQPGTNAGVVYKIIPTVPTTPCGSDCGTADFNGDGDVGTDADIEAFFACLSGNCCATCFPGGADFNQDGDIGTDADIESFFRVLSGGPC